MKLYDHFEIGPCKRCEEPDSPQGFTFEACKPEAADVWTLYGHIRRKGLQAIGDFPTRQMAEQVYTRITGQPFTGSDETDRHLQIMRAGPTLLEALDYCIPIIEENCPDDNYDPHYSPEAEVLAIARKAFFQATGNAPLKLPEPMSIERLLAEKRQIAAIWGVEDVQSVRPDLDDDQAWQVLQLIDRRLHSDTGICWETLRQIADELFGSNDEKEASRP